MDLAPRWQESIGQSFPRTIVFAAVSAVLAASAVLEYSTTIRSLSTLQVNIDAPGMPSSNYRDGEEME
jgi:hypothetical protein